MATFQSNIAAAQVAGYNFPGGSGGLTAQPGGFNDPVLELGSASVITALYTMTGNEAVNDIIQIALIGQGAVVSPDSTVTGNGIATSASISVGDTDTVGATVTPDAARYSAIISVGAAVTTTATSFSGGTVLNAPASTTDDPVWIQAKFTAMNTPVAGKVLCFRLRLTDNR